MKPTRGNDPGCHPLHNTWRNMQNRCYREGAHNYADYGGRGIYVCERWLDNGEHDGFANFITDMGCRPEGHTLDRIDSNGIYCPSNCRWADWDTQSRNRQGVKLSVEDVAEIKHRLEVGGARGFQSALAREFGVHRHTISDIKHGRLGASIAASTA